MDKIIQGVAIVSLMSLSMVSSALAKSESGLEHTSHVVRRVEVSPEVLKIQGGLTCALPEQNNGRACNLSLTDTTTGKTYNLSQVREAMELYHAGHRLIQLEAKSKRGGGMELIQIRPL